MNEIGVDFSKLTDEQIDDLLDDHSDGDDFELEDFSNRRHEENPFESDFHIKSIPDESTKNELGEK